MNVHPSVLSGKNSIADFCRGLKSVKHFILSCHVLPEGDAIGSLLAMDSLLRRLGKKTTIICEDDFPKRLVCLSPKRWNAFGSRRFKASDYDAILLVDCPNLSRIGQVQELIGPHTKIFNIDHHVSNHFFGHHNYVVPSASASGEVVMEFFRYYQMKLTPDEAKNIYIAIATDTGSFRYSNTSSRTHRMVADLIDCGIDVEKINEEIHTNYSLNKVYLYSHLLKKIRTTARGRIAWATMKRSDLKRFHVEYEDTEGFIDFLKYMREVRIAFFASELPYENSIRVSFRSQGAHDVNQIATHFKGGGHRKASGCLFQGISLKEAERLILKRLRKEIR